MMAEVCMNKLIRYAGVASVLIALLFHFINAGEQQSTLANEVDTGMNMLLFSVN